MREIDPTHTPALATNGAHRGFILRMDDHLTPVVSSVSEGTSIVSESLSFEAFFDREAHPLFRRLYAVTGDPGESEEVG